MERRRAAIVAERFQQSSRLSLDPLELSIERLRSLKRCGRLEEARKEEINADRCAQQLIASLQPVLAMQGSMQSEEERSRFWDAVRPTKEKIEEVIERLKLESAKEAAPLSINITDPSPQEQGQAHQSGTLKTSAFYDDQDMREYHQRVLQDAQTHQQLAQDIQGIEQLMHDMEQIVMTQGDAVDSIEANVENASENLRGGEKNLRKAVTYKTASYPLAGAAVGAAVAGGPIGIMAGVNAAIIGSIGGAVAGAFGGKYWKRKVKEESSEKPS